MDNYRDKNMSRTEKNIITNIINILAKEKHITIDEQVRMLEMLKKGEAYESAN